MTFIKLLLFLIFGPIVFFIILGLMGIFFFKRKVRTHAKKQQEIFDNFRQESYTQSPKSEKIFDNDEGEYVDFEEIE